jgi:hypothetical protein
MCCSHLSCPNGARTWSTCRADPYGPTPKTVKRRLADHVWRRMLADHRRRPPTGNVFDPTDTVA